MPFTCISTLVNMKLRGLDVLVIVTALFRINIDILRALDVTVRSKFHIKAENDKKLTDPFI